MHRMSFADGELTAAAEALRPRRASGGCRQDFAELAV